MIWKREHKNFRKKITVNRVMNFDLAVVRPWQRTRLFYSDGTWDKIKKNSVPVSLINWTLEKPWIQNYLTDDKFAIRKNKAYEQKVHLLSTFPVPKLVWFLIRFSECDISMQLGFAFHYMRFSEAKQHSSLGAESHLFKSCSKIAFLLKNV